MWTFSINPERRVSSPTAVTSMVTGPRERVRPACNSSPTATSTGTDSPVRGALLTEPAPEIMFPSAGINSPLLISIWSPRITNPIGISSTASVFMATGVIKLEDDTTSIEVIEKLPKPFFGTLLAVRGKRSSPPCIASLAFTRASFSMCSVHDTKIKTSNASSHACR